MSAMCLISFTRHHVDDNVRGIGPMYYVMKDKYVPQELKDKVKEFKELEKQGEESGLFQDNSEEYSMYLAGSNKQEGISAELKKYRDVQEEIYKLIEDLNPRKIKHLALEELFLKGEYKNFVRVIEFSVAIGLTSDSDE